MMADLLEKQVGEYRLIRFLGNGNFGVVYEGVHIHLETHAAVKLLKGSFTEVEIKEFLDEARILARLEHPNIVRIFTFNVAMLDEQKLPFLAMSLAPNGTLLKRHPRGTPLPLSTIVTYVKQIASALQYAHTNKYIHRDVKPENILLGKNDELLLSDFGIAVVVHGTRSQETQKPIGSWAYAAPEQFVGKAVPASDQYSLAVVAYEWLCGERPFHGDFNQLAVQHHRNIPPPPLHEKMSISPAVEQVIMKALEEDPKNRFPTIQAFAEALEQAVNASQQDARVSQQPPPILPSLQPHRQPSRAPTFQPNLQALPLPSPQPQLGSVNQQQGGGGAQNPAQQGGWNQQQQAAWGPKNPAQQGSMIEVFCCYAHEDEHLLNELKRHLSPQQRQQLINVWHDRDISAGIEWKQEIEKHLNEAHIILLLISPDFISSEYCYGTEMKRALELHKRGEARVIPVILRPVGGWKKVPPGEIQLGQLQALPKDAKPITHWTDHDEAWKDVTEGISRVANELLENPSSNNQIFPPLVNPSAKNAFWESYWSKKKIVISSFLLVIVIVLIVISASLRSLPLTRVQIIATAAANSPEDLYKLVISESPAFNDLLLRDQVANRWDNSPQKCDKSVECGGCKFAEGAYHSYVLKPYVAECYAKAKWFPQTPIFALQVKMTFIRGYGAGGLIFGYKGLNLGYYRFSMTLEGYFDLYDPGTGQQLPYGIGSAFKSNSNQLTVIVYHSVIYLYLSDRSIGQVPMEPDTSVAGMIGLFSVDDQQNPTEEVFHDLKVWNN